MAQAKVAVHIIPPCIRIFTIVDSISVWMKSRVEMEIEKEKEIDAEMLVLEQYTGARASMCEMYLPHSLSQATRALSCVCCCFRLILLVLSI